MYLILHQQNGLGHVYSKKKYSSIFFRFYQKKMTSKFKKYMFLDHL